MNSFIKNILFALAAMLLISSCEKDKEEEIPNNESDILSYAIASPQAEVDINDYNYTLTLSFPTDVLSAEDLSAEFELSVGATAYIDDIVQISGQTRNNFESPFKYSVWAKDEITMLEWDVKSINNTYTLSWGLGGFQKASLSNNRDYEWYIDQANTGEHSDNNCGPTVTTIASLWSNADFSNTPEDAREAYRPDGGWWYTDDIDAYLTDNNIPHYYITLSSSTYGTQEIIIDELEGGNIVILCLDMYYVTRTTNAEWRVDKFYHTNGKDWGHFIIAKGFKNVDGQIFYEIYDPNSWNQKYSDGTLKGKDRYYRPEDIYKATSIWWNYAIVITEDDMKKADTESLDPLEIPRMWGR